jgi:hypothetical protein
MKMVSRWSEPVTDLKGLGILDNLKSELEIKKQIGLSVCQSITSPMLIGSFRPAILLPPFKSADDELYLILKHELIHFKRHDLWYKALILAATILHWFNPVVYLMAKAAAVQCEISCDTLILDGADLQKRKQYGETIIGVVRNGARLQTALSTDFYGGEKGMKNRISSIMDTKRKKAGVAILCAVLVATIGAGAIFAADSQRNATGSSGLVKLEADLICQYLRTADTPKHFIENFAHALQVRNGAVARLFLSPKIREQISPEVIGTSTLVKKIEINEAADSDNTWTYNVKAYYGPYGNQLLAPAFEMNITVEPERYLDGLVLPGRYFITKLDWISRW